MKCCECCNQVIVPKVVPPQPEARVFMVEGRSRILTVLPHDDAFFIVVKGKWVGNLIHRFDEIK